ncbi:hypothetical protein D3C81_1766080 [compost metagenome]
MRRLGTFTVEQKLLFRLLAQQAVFHAKLIVSQLDFLDIRQLQRLEISAKLLACVIPEHYALLVEQVAQGLSDFGGTHVHAFPIRACSVSTNRLAQGEALTTFSGSIIASNLKECSPLPY